MSGADVMKRPSTSNPLRAQLEAQRDLLADRLERIGRDRRRENEPLAPGFADQGIQRQNDEVLDQLEASTREELTQFNAALHRLETGRYGVCETCAMPIELPRLHALPQVTTCAGCADRQAAHRGGH